MEKPVYLEIPTTPPTFIPTGMTEDDLQLVLATIELWRPRLAPPKAPKVLPPVESFCGILADVPADPKKL